MKQIVFFTIFISFTYFCKAQDLHRFTDSLLKSQNNLTLTYDSVSEGISVYHFKISTDPAVGYLAIIKLDVPETEIVISPEKKEKYLTSTFAKDNNCIIAINGEAGETPAKTAKLGQWTGNWISKGKVVLMHDTKLRPFISFDSLNHAYYSFQEEIDTIYNFKKYNTIFGRTDIIMNGKVYDSNKYNYARGKETYPRTIMALNKEGNVLYLMVIDGRRPGYSIGLTLEKSAQILKSVGAYNAMACDQGGSSCMFLRDKIVNRPCDNVERVVYSHFGIKIKK